MTYAVNLKDTGLAMLIGQLNYDHNPYAIPHEDTWDKAVISKWDTIPGRIPIASLISPVVEWYGNEPVVFKKELVFGSDTVSFKIYADDIFEVYIDGIKVADNDSVNAPAGTMADFNVSIEPEAHTVAIVLTNFGGGGHIEFSITDGDDLRSISDTSWPFLIEDGSYPISEMVRIGWEMLTPENMTYKNIHPIGDGLNEWELDVLRSSIGNSYAKNNYNDYYWPYAMERIVDTTWPLPDDQCLRLAPTSEWQVPDTSFVVKKHINFKHSTVVVSASGDDRWELWIDGTMKGAGNGNLVKEVTFSVVPGEHTVIFKNVNTVGTGHVSFRITNGPMTYRSDTSWKCAIIGTHDSLMNAVVSRYQHDVSVGDDYILTAKDGRVTLKTDIESSVVDPDGNRRITTLITYGTANNAKINVNTFPLVTPKNTGVTIITKLDEYQVKEVDVKYDRILFNDLFAAVAPVKVRAINLNFDESGLPVADSLVLDELNRRYGLAMDSLSVDVILDNHDQGVSTFHIQHTNDSLSYYGTEVITVINSLDVRVASTQLDGFINP